MPLTLGGKPSEKSISDIASSRLVRILSSVIKIGIYPNFINDELWTTSTLGLWAWCAARWLRFSVPRSPAHEALLQETTMQGFHTPGLSKMAAYIFCKFQTTRVGRGLDVLFVCGQPQAATGNFLCCQEQFLSTGWAFVGAVWDGHSCFVARLEPP